MSTATLLRACPLLGRAAKDRRLSPREEAMAQSNNVYNFSSVLGGRRVTDSVEFREEVKSAIKRDRADHVLRSLTSVGIWVLAGVVSFVALQVWTLSNQAPQVALLLQQTSKTLEVVAETQRKQDVTLGTVTMSQETLRVELGRVQGQISTAQNRLQEIERALARKGIM